MAQVVIVEIYILSRGDRFSVRCSMKECTRPCVLLCTQFDKCTLPVSVHVQGFSLEKV